MLLLLLLALVLALDPEPVRAAMPVEVIEAPKTFAVCGDSIQVIYSLPAPVDEASVRLCAFASGVSRRLCSEPWPAASTSASAMDLMPKGLFRSGTAHLRGTQSWGNKESHVSTFLGLTPTKALMAMSDGQRCGADQDMAPIVRHGLQRSGESGLGTPALSAINSWSLSDNSGGAEIRPSIWGKPSGSRWGSVISTLRCPHSPLLHLHVAP